jgi:hypothetical protein
MKVRVLQDIVDEYFIVQYKKYFWSKWFTKKHFKYDNSESHHNYDTEEIVKQRAIKLANQLLKTEVVYEH